MCCPIVGVHFDLSPWMEKRGGSSLSTLTEGILGRLAHSLAAGREVGGLVLLGPLIPK